MREVKRLSEFRDQISVVLLSAPDNFPKFSWMRDEDVLDLESAFDSLRFGLETFANPRMKDPARRDEARRLLEASYEAYKAGEKQKGAHLIQDMRLVIFPKFYDVEKDSDGTDAM